MTHPRQLALALGHRESHAREDFLEGPSNAAALALVSRWPDWPTRMAVLVGPEGSGKSHMASIWAAEAGARLASGRSLDESSVPTALATGALVLENLAAGEVNERALFHLINLAREEGAYLLITARSAPAGWSVVLPDLASRLREMPVVAVTAPDDLMLRAVLLKLFADRQLDVDENLLGYLATRIERSFAAANAAVAALDREALRQRRPITRALAGELFRATAR
jgi:chromosomal replication initiation ATPase DnaA